MVEKEERDIVSFGFRKVARNAKQGLVRSVFTQVAERYDLMNDLMSLGVHRLWKDAFIDRLDPRPGEAILDVAGGTGDIADRARTRTAARPAFVTVVDINDAMIEQGRDRMFDRGEVGGIDWVVGDAEKLPFAPSMFDATTIAFGIRNVTDIDAALREMYRVLKPGGRFLCLEFSHVNVRALDRLYEAYSFNILPRLGAAVAGNRDAYTYLVESIRRFPDQSTFATMISSAGFENVRYRNFSGGIAAVHSGWRL
ncbi:MAG: bifunctional demethylmenaquinone methyltransferase/2-methoxy-6-polyprenyl-1,4-benzoquinol methylase UbiE [Alphaproteobacteria bacterium]|nr:bifunctional demethylmenaquinone methyltransferase/2-methoxy-6-polyprenyl-1,4-benzoquinol methylase UbiE [Alphaproteobacteria bacterium]